MDHPTNDFKVSTEGSTVYLWIPQEVYEVTEVGQILGCLKGSDGQVYSIQKVGGGVLILIDDFG